MSFNFPLFLVIATLASGLVSLADKLYCYWRYQRANLDVAEPPKVVAYCKSLFPVFLIVLLLRSFIIEPFRVPTGSLEPTVLPGDFILSNKFIYGLRLPLWGTKLIPIREPKRGDIVIFHTPQDNKTWLVKRLIGLPGDKISYLNKTLYVNGIEAKQTFIQNSHDVEGLTAIYPAKEYAEDLLGVKHRILIRNNIQGVDFKDLVVPAQHYFMMGDNRDDSEDSRWWGFVPADNIEGQAFMIWFSVDQFDWTNFRWARIGTWL